MLFVDKIKTQRESLRITQKEMASKLGIDTPMYSRIERGERPAKREYLETISSTLHINHHEATNLWLADQVIERLESEEQAGEVLEVVSRVLSHYKAEDEKEQPITVDIHAQGDINDFLDRVIQGDCLQVLPSIPDKSIDMILCDLPYGTTQNKWDSIIDLNKLWAEYTRIIKDTGVIALTSQGSFTAKLILSNEEWFKYKIVWVKSKATNFLNAKKQPLRKHEDICIFYKKQPTYHPQMEKGEKYDKGIRKDQYTGSYGDFKPHHVQSDGQRYPSDVYFYEPEHDDSVYFKTAESEGPVWHPTQKPVELGRYLIKTFTNPGDIVLDNACGSGSFLVAAAKEGRHYIGIELNENVLLHKKDAIDYIKVCEDRLRDINPELF